MWIDLARKLNNSFLMMTRLDTIATRQKQTRVRDAIFACFVALAAVISVTTVSTAAHAANTSFVSSR
ncbi:MAG: hypothetical protein ABI867_17070 [Kofleriaceae bacterium]